MLLLRSVAAGDRGFVQEVIDLCVALRLPHVVAPDVGPMVGDEDGERALEPRIGEHRLELLDQLAFAGRVPDHRHEVEVAIGDAPDALEHLQVADLDVIAVAREVAGQDRREAVGVDDAAGATLPGGETEDRVALARPEAVVCRRSDDPSVAVSTVKNSSGRIRSLWTPVGASSSPPPSAGPEIPPPVPDTQPRA
jgi:hypothetical protein